MEKTNKLQENSNKKHDMLICFINKYLSFNKIKNYIWSFIRGIIVIGICYIILYPLITKLSVSFMEEIDLFDSTVEYIPKHFTLKNWKISWNAMHGSEAFMKTLTLSGSGAILQLLSCTLAAYGLSRFNFWGKKILLALLFAFMIVPPQTILTPLFLNFRYFDIFGIFKLTTGHSLNLVDSTVPFTLMSLTCTGLKNGLYVLILMQYFRGVPKELEEAAAIDGCGTFKTFFVIMLPGIVPMMVTVFLFSFVWQWNDTLYSSVFFTTSKTLAMALDSITLNPSDALNATAYVLMVKCTGSLILILPLIVLYIFAQRFFVQSIQRSGIVG